jgi:alkylation response protein AidB-like acyl-CoA dehydrogenase
VNGQKIWTSWAHYGDWIFCLVRTDADAVKRQEGISFLLMDMKTPGRHRAPADPDGRRPRGERRSSSTT